MGEVPVKFKAWVRQLVLGKQEGLCLAVSLRHLGHKQGADVARTTMPKPEEIGEGEAESQLAIVADQLWSQAQDDADAFEGVQTYAFYSWFDGSPDKAASRYTARFSSRVAGEENSEDESVSEPPTATGQVSQAMRHTEAMARIMTQGQMHMVSSLTRANESKDRLIEKLLDEKMAAIETVEEAMTKKHERQMEMEERRLKAKVMEDAINRVGALVPLVLTKLTGQKLLPAGAKGAPAMKELLATIDSEQMEKLGGILKPEQTAMLAEMMMEQQEDETKDVAPTH